MKLLINIDDKLLSKALRLTKAKTKKDAIVIPMKEYLERHKRKELAKLIGNFQHGMTLSDLHKSRRQWKNF